MFATGKFAMAICDRCHFKYRYQDLMPDGNSPSLRVCVKCYDQRDPYRLAPRKTEAITMAHPRPDEPLVPATPYIVTEDGHILISETTITPVHRDGGDSIEAEIEPQ